MRALSTSEWQEANMRFLREHLGLVRERLIALGSDHAGTAEMIGLEPVDAAPGAESTEREAYDTASTTAARPALEELCESFGLSIFERDVLLLCAGIELDSDFPQLCAASQHDTQMDYPTFRLAFATLPGAHWGAIVPAGALRYWRLIEVDGGGGLTSSRLRIDERILHHLVGVSYVDERLANFFEAVPVPATMLASYRDHAERIVRLWSREFDERPVIHLSGNTRGTRRMLAAAGCAGLGLRLHALRAADVPGNPAEREALIRLWRRETLLLHSALLLEADDADDPVALRHAQSFAESLDGLLLVSGDTLSPTARRPVARIEIHRPTVHEQRALWELSLGPVIAQLNGDLDQVLSQFQFDEDAIHSASRVVREHAPHAEPENIGPLLWQACRSHTRSSLDGLAERIETRACWEDLVLPEEQHQTLGEIASQVRQRTKVYQEWGFGARGVRGLGISALFAGPSGTGKTLAAEVLASALQLDLYRIDLSQVVSKYIGETEKNLRSVFDAADHSGAVLLFDEADALFGKRSEVRDSHDRYANIEVSYLLQRMEAYRGLAILTTNRRDALDGAFLRRIRFVVAFPFPDANLRARIWAHIFPPDTPTDQLDMNKLSRLNVAGGNIRNIALNAAFLAADLGQPVRMTHLLRTARSECAKLEKPITAAETGGWV